MNYRLISIIGLTFLVTAWAAGDAQGGSEKLGALASSDGKRTIVILGHSDFLPDRTDLYKTPLIGLPDVLTDRIIEHLKTQNPSPCSRGRN